MKHFDLYKVKGGTADVQGDEWIATNEGIQEVVRLFKDRFTSADELIQIDLIERVGLIWLDLEVT